MPYIGPYQKPWASVVKRSYQFLPCLTDHTVQQEHHYDDLWCINSPQPFHSGHTTLITTTNCCVHCSQHSQANHTKPNNTLVLNACMHPYSLTWYPECGYQILRSKKWKMGLHAILKWNKALTRGMEWLDYNYSSQSTFTLSQVMMFLSYTHIKQSHDHLVSNIGLLLAVDLNGFLACT